MENVFDLFKERGLIAQATDEASIRELLGKEKITFYTGFDPTADSLHVGHFMQLIIMRYMQQAGHRPIVLLGGGTTMVGDPTGKTDMRKMLTQEQIQHNADEFKKQMSKFIDFSEGKAIMANNADWLLGLNYVIFCGRSACISLSTRCSPPSASKHVWKKASRSWNSTIC